MPFDFFGARKKAVIGMAHIGALPGTPLYDAKGGMSHVRQADVMQSNGVIHVVDAVVLP